MKFAVGYNTAYYGVDPERMVAFAQLAEECGFEALLMQEHVALYPGAMVGSFEMPPSLPYADPLDSLSFIAGATQRILLGTGVLLVPYHHPVILAKRLATVDVLSRGRMRLLSVGLGSFPREADAVGVDFRSRGRRADEAIDVLRLLWAGDEDGVSFDGEFFRFDRLVSFPKPHDGARLPIHVGGSSRAAARRAGRRGDGFFPGGALTAEERRIQFDLARSAAEEAGRDPDALEYSRWGSLDMSADRAEALAAEGVTRVVVNVAATDPSEQRDEMHAFAERFGLPDEASALRAT